MYKRYYIILVLYSLISCSTYEEYHIPFHLSISPVIDQNDNLNNEIIECISNFLQTKNANRSFNKNWWPADFEKFTYPYKELLDIENSKFGRGFYLPTLMEIIDTDDENKKEIKLAFIGFHEETGDRIVKCIYSLLAIKESSRIYLKNILDDRVKGWQQEKQGNIRYFISPSRVVNEQEMIQQENDVKVICEFLEMDPLEIAYYSCVDPEELFNIKGFDYTHAMYLSDNGGLADFGNRVFSANASECYTHEVVHVYINSKYPRIQPILNEGIATFLGGSNQLEYTYHRKRMRQWVGNNPLKDLKQYLDPYRNEYIDDNTSISYMVGALICERTLRKFGKNRLLELMATQGNLWEILESVDLDRYSFNLELSMELERESL